MATSLFFMPTDENSVETPNEFLRNTHLVNGSGEIRKAPQSLGPKPGPQTCQKKKMLRGMGIAQLERALRAREEKNKTVAAVGDTIPNNATRLPVHIDHVLVKSKM